MSRRADRARAESGIIHRDGKLWKKEDWYAIHPTREMRLAQTLTIEPELEKQAAAEVLSAASQGKPYFCTKCMKWHRTVGATYNAHRQFEDGNVPTQEVAKT